MAIRRLVTKVCPVSGPAPLTMLTRPAGTPARSQASASISVVSGVFSAGFNTIVLPAAIAGSTLHTAICKG